MIRVVLDTNVLISALILRGPTNELVGYWKGSEFTPVVSKAIVGEYLRALAYPKFGLTVDTIKMLMHKEFFPYMEPVQVEEVPEVIHQDPSDNQFLACAKSGACKFIVSGDKHLLALKKYEKIQIITVRNFLDFLARERLR